MTGISQSRQIPSTTPSGVEREKETKKGKWLDRARGYFGSLRKAVNSIREQIIAEGFENGERTLEQALRTISEADERFEKIISNINA